ncbi:unnamed protein product, partial [Brenthis ino]
MMMFSWPIPATAANLIETSQLRRRYYSASALSIPVTLILRWDDYSTRPVRVRRALRALRGTGVKHRQLPNSRRLLRLTIQKDSITKLGPTRDSNPGPPSVQPYMLASTPPRQLNIYILINIPLKDIQVFQPLLGSD